MVADLLAERVGGRFAKHKARADVVEGRLGPLPAPGTAQLASTPYISKRRSQWSRRARWHCTTNRRASPTTFACPVETTSNIDDRGTV
jgi:hypothetical protein